MNGNQPSNNKKFNNDYPIKNMNVREFSCKLTLLILACVFQTLVIHRTSKLMALNCTCFNLHANIQVEEFLIPICL